MDPVFAQLLNESDVFKVILNNGFMALFVVWVLFKGEPRYREMIDRMEAKHESTITNLTAEHKKMVEMVVKNHEAVMANVHKECREERREILAAVAREGELNRESRHEFGNSLQSAVADLYRGAERDRRREANRPLPKDNGSKSHAPLPRDPGQE